MTQDTTRKVDLELQSRALFKPSTVDEESRTIEMTWTTGAAVLRESYLDGPFYEELDMAPSAIRMDRLNGGAPLLNSHSARTLADQIGVVERAWLDGNEGRAIVRFSNRDEVRGIWEDVKSGIIRNVSVGYRVYEYTQEQERSGVRVFRATDWEPHEISLVPIPADASSQIRAAEQSSVNPAQVGQQTEIRQMDEIKATPSEPTKGPDIDQIRAEAITAERSRIEAIKQAVRAAKLDTDFADKLIADGIEADAARSAVLAQLERATPVIASHVQVQTVQDERDTLRSGMTEAIMNRLDPRSALTENGKRFRSLSLLEMAREALHNEGVNTRGMSKLEIAGRALHATGDFPIITADVANKTLRQGYENAGRTFQAWARQTSAPDFKDIKRVQLGEAPSLEKVLEAGEFTRGTVAEGQEKYRLFTYGKVVGVTRQLLINDDLSAFSRIPELFGRAAADLESELVYGLLVSNPVMADGQTVFSAPHNNVGTAGAITIASLSEARKKMRQQKGLAGRYINVQPRYLIVGPDRETEAQQLLNNDYVPNTQNNINPFAGATLQLIVDPRLEGGRWYVAADPSQIDTLEYAYLDGQGGVVIETQMGFNVDGMEIKVRHDFGTGIIDYRGLFTNAGA